MSRYGDQVVPVILGTEGYTEGVLFLFMNA